MLTEDTVTEDGVTYMAQYARELTGDEVNVSVPSEVTLSSGGKQSISVEIQLTEEGKSNLEEEFPNGIYVEGFVTLTPRTDGEVTLSYPFMGYYGDQADIPIFDSDIYDEENASLYEIQLGQFNNSNGSGYILGHNIYVKENYEAYDEDKIAIKGGVNTKNVTAVLSMLRNSDELNFLWRTAMGIRFTKKRWATYRRPISIRKLSTRRWRTRDLHRTIPGTSLCRMESIPIRFPLRQETVRSQFLFLWS